MSFICEGYITEQCNVVNARCGESMLVKDFTRALEEPQGRLLELELFRTRYSRVSLESNSGKPAHASN